MINPTDFERGQGRADVVTDAADFASFDRLHARAVRIERLQSLRTQLHDALIERRLVRVHVDRSDASGSADVTAYRKVDGSYHVRIEVLATERATVDTSTSYQIAQVLDFAEDVLTRCRIV